MRKASEAFKVVQHDDSSEQEKTANDEVTNRPLVPETGGLEHSILQHDM